MNNGYNRFYIVQRNPSLFRQNSHRPTASYYPVQQPLPAGMNSYAPVPVLNSRQPTTFSQLPSASGPFLPNPQPYYPNQLYYPSSPPFSPLPSPAYSYAPTVSSKGLTIVLIATLIMVALDLAIVRPQKGRITR